MVCDLVWFVGVLRAVEEFMGVVFGHEKVSVRDDGTADGTVAVPPGHFPFDVGESVCDRFEPVVNGAVGSDGPYGRGLAVRSGFDVERVDSDPGVWSWLWPR